MLDTKTHLELTKWIVFSIPDDPFFDKARSEQYYIDSTNALGDMFDSVAKSFGEGYRVFSELNQHDYSTAYFDYEIVYRYNINDLKRFDDKNISQILIDLEAIYAIIVTIAEENNLIVG